MRRLSAPALATQMSSELADAWQQFAGLVIQEFIYDCWWSCLSPDTCFPAHVRGVLNGAFAALLKRGKTLNVHTCSTRILDSLAVRAALWPPGVRLLCCDMLRSCIAMCLLQSGM